MIATYRGGGAELTFSTDTMFESASVVVAPAAGSAQCLGDVAPVHTGKDGFGRGHRLGYQQGRTERQDSWTPFGVWHIAVIFHACCDGKDNMAEHQS